MFMPKIAEVKYTLIGLQDICMGQTSGDWLSRDKQVSGHRKYGSHIAEVKYTLIGLQDICIGQTSSDWLSRDKQVSGLRK